MNTAHTATLEDVFYIFVAFKHVFQPRQCKPGVLPLEIYKCVLFQIVSVSLDERSFHVKWPCKSSIEGSMYLFRSQTVGEVYRFLLKNKFLDDLSPIEEKS